MAKDKELARRIRQNGKDNIRNHFGDYYFKGVPLMLAGLSAKIVDDVVNHGDLWIELENGRKSPTVRFSCADGYAVKRLNLVQCIEATAGFYAHEPDAKDSRQYRFMVAMGKAVRDFQKSERDNP